MDPLPGTAFGVAYLGVAPTVSGLAVGALVAGIGSIVAAIFVSCLGPVGAGNGWGLLVGGAFAVLAGLLGCSGVGLGMSGMRQVGRSAGLVAGGRLGVAGIWCGVAGLALTVISMALTVLLAL